MTPPETAHKDMYSVNMITHAIPLGRQVHTISLNKASNYQSLQCYHFELQQSHIANNRFVVTS